MEASKAISLINNLAYRPGWELRAREVPTDLRDEYGMPETVIVFSYSLRTLNSNRVEALNGYPTGEVTIGDAMPLDVALIDTEDQLTYAVFLRLMEKELHEGQEFLRRKDQGMRAPFHPHRPEGREAWDKLSDWYESLEETT